MPFQSCPLLDRATLVFLTSLAGVCLTLAPVNVSLALDLSNTPELVNTVCQQSGCTLV